MKRLITAAILLASMTSIAAEKVTHRFFKAGWNSGGPGIYSADFKPEWELNDRNELSDGWMLPDNSVVFSFSIRKKKQAGVIHRKRAAAAGEIQNKVEKQLQQLGIPNARFQAALSRTETYDLNGSDQARFLFSANKQLPLEEISKVASGGEISRLMICIKSMVSDRKGMPTLIFDEIDAGVSGEIADKVGGIMVGLAEGRQVMAITHLPQVASRGSDHFVVFKEDTSDATYTRIRKLKNEERVTEIARMLSGEEVSDEALSNARVLLRV